MRLEQWADKSVPTKNINRHDQINLLADQFLPSFHCTVVTKQLTNKGFDGRQTVFDVFNSLYAHIDI